MVNSPVAIVAPVSSVPQGKKSALTVMYKFVTPHVQPGPNPQAVPWVVTTVTATLVFLIPSVVRVVRVKLV